MDLHANFAISTVKTPPSSPSAGTSLAVQDGDGIKFPIAPFNCVVCPAGLAPLVSNAEIVRVTVKSGDTFTITRNQEGSNNRTIQAGDQIYAGITAKTLTDIEGVCPVGSINAYGGSSAPSNWLLCDGASYLRSSYPSLFAVLSTTYGAADGTHFNVPNLQQKFPLGKAASGTGSTLGGTGGAIDHTHSVGGLSVPKLSIPSLTVNAHTHGLSGPNAGAMVWMDDSFGICLFGQQGGAADQGPNFSAQKISYGFGGTWGNSGATRPSAPLTGATNSAGSSTVASEPGSGGGTGTGTTGSGTSGTQNPPYTVVNYIIRAQ